MQLLQQKMALLGNHSPRFHQPQGGSSQTHLHKQHQRRVSETQMLMPSDTQNPDPMLSKTTTKSVPLGAVTSRTPPSAGTPFVGGSLSTTATENTTDVAIKQATNTPMTRIGPSHRGFLSGSRGTIGASGSDGFDGSSASPAALPGLLIWLRARKGGNPFLPTRLWKWRRSCMSGSSSGGAAAAAEVAGAEELGGRR